MSERSSCGAGCGCGGAPPARREREHWRSLDQLAGTPEARAYLERFRAVGTPASEEISEMSYVELQSSGDEYHGHGVRRYSAGGYLPELSDEAIDTFLRRGLVPGEPEPDWRLMPNGYLGGYGGAIADVPVDGSAFSFRDSFVESFVGTSWTDPAEDEVRIARARAWNATMDRVSRLL